MLSQVILPVHIVRADLQLHCLPNKLFQIAGYSKKDPGIFEFNDVVMVELMFCHHQFVWTSKPYVPVVPSFSDLYRSTSLSDVHVTTLAGHAVNPQCPHSKVVLHRTNETGDLWQQANTFNVVFGQHFSELIICCLDIQKKINQGGLLFWLGGLTARLRAHCICLIL
jgi:hypothetical protein